MYIGPLIFALAPAINTMVSLVWHPEDRQSVGQFELEMPGWKLPAGIVLLAAGTFLVLMSKEEAEAHKGAGIEAAEAPRRRSPHRNASSKK